MGLKIEARPRVSRGTQWGAITFEAANVAPKPIPQVTAGLTLHEKKNDIERGDVRRHEYEWHDDGQAKAPQENQNVGEHDGHDKNDHDRSHGRGLKIFAETPFRF